MKKELLDCIQEGCETASALYKKSQDLQLEKNPHARTIPVTFNVLQLLGPYGITDGGRRKKDIVRQSAQLYDEYEGNEEYIHIPNVDQMMQNLQGYPVIGAFNTKTGELEGVVTIKFHQNNSLETTDPYYPKPGAEFYSITGVIVRQRKGVLHKGLGSHLYLASILGIQKYASSHPEQNLELNAVIDCTNLPSLYALSSANRKITQNEYVGKNKKLNAILDGIYTVRDEENRLVEAPTYVIKINLKPVTTEKTAEEDTTFVFSANSETPNYCQYELLLDKILSKVKREEQQDITTILDEDAGMVDYHHIEKSGITLESIKLERNGAENIGRKRTPRGDVDDFVGPMPDFKNYIEME